MSEQPQIQISYEHVGRKGRVRIKVELPDKTTFTDEVEVGKFRAREGFLDNLCKGREGLPRDDIRAQLEGIAASMVNAESGEAQEPSSGGSEAELLVQLASGLDLFKTPGEHDAQGYATVDDHERRDTWPIDSEAFDRWLTREYYRKYGGVPKSQAREDAKGFLTARALFDGETREVAVRVAGHDGCVYIDLADKDRRIVKVTRDGWEIVPGTSVPVRFVRKRGMLPLPAPVHGGSIKELRPLVNVADEDAWVLLVITLVTYLLPDGPFVIMVVNGEQGSAKSTLCRILRVLVDPNKAPARRLPREERDLMIAAQNGWLLVFDNLSGLPAWLSDSLCSLATGAGFATRELYSDGEEKVFAATRPVVVNGISDLAERPDFLDRSVILTLKRIPKRNRKQETELMARVKEVAPRVFGALLDGVSAVLRNHASVRLAELPRMADYAVRGVAAEGAFGWKPGTFMAAYMRNCEEAYQVAIEASPVGAPLMALIDARAPWKGTAAQLLADIETSYASDTAKKDRHWPKTPRGMRGAVDRLAPSLRALGYVVESSRDPGPKRDRLITLDRESRPGMDNRQDEGVPGGAKEGDADGPDGADGCSRDFVREPATADPGPEAPQTGSPGIVVSPREHLLAGGPLRATVRTVRTVRGRGGRGPAGVPCMQIVTLVATRRPAVEGTAVDLRHVLSTAALAGQGRVVPWRCSVTRVSAVRLAPASRTEARSGLLGFVSCRYGGLLLDTLALRRTADGRLALSFPSKLDRFGIEHPYYRPLNDAARLEIERQIISQLGFYGKVAR